MVDINALTAANTKRCENAKPTRTTLASAVAARLVKAKPRYQAVEAKTGVPWAVIAVIHQRESSQDWTTHLGQGDPLNQVTVHVPAGRGPFFGSDAWERGAIDALADCAPHLARKKNWTGMGDVLTNLELYNGVGYAAKGKPSPYIWAGTDQYVSGKYVRDGVYDPGKVDPQLGCAAMLIEMMKLDPSITFTGAKIAPPSAPAKPSITNPAPGSIGALIASIFAAIFKRK